MCSGSSMGCGLGRLLRIAAHLFILPVRGQNQARGASGSTRPGREECGCGHAGPAARSRSILAVLLAGCGSSNPLGGGPASADLKSIVVGSADFPESKIIAEIYAQTLEANGFTIRRQFGIGSRETYIPAVKDHSIDLIPDYTGNLLQYFDPKTTATSPDAVVLALLRVLPGDLSILTPSPAADTDTVAVTRATATKWNLKTIADLAAHRPEVKFGAPSEFLNRTEGLPGLKKNLRPRHQSEELRGDQRRRRPGRRCERSSTAPSPPPTSSVPRPPSRRTTWWRSTTRRTTSWRPTSSRW